MLAVQQVPKMGSNEPDPDPFLPFGYSIDMNQEPLFDAPEPPPGAPLLSETDNRVLSSFFQDITSNQYSMPSFGVGLNFSDVWLDLPPQFMGATTSFGSQYATSQGPWLPQSYPRELPGMPSGTQLMAPPPPPPYLSPSQQQQHHHQHHHQHQHQHQHQHHHHQQQQQPPDSFENPSDDVLNAAATLIQNGSRIAKHDDDFSQRFIYPPVGHVRHQPLEEFKEESQKGMAQEQQNIMLNEWTPGTRDRRPTRSMIASDYQWGADASFGPPSQGYKSQVNEDAVESMQQEQLKYLDCLEPNRSNATTYPGSPAGTSLNNSAIAGSADRSNVSHERAEDSEAPPRKRRKSKNQKDVAITEEEAVSSEPKPTRRRKSKAERSDSISESPRDTGGAAGKRRKSAAAQIKYPRENLSEEQKRENHIKSEQKRRTLIKEGFDDLCELVPGLKGGGFSKSTMLAMTAEWLEELLKGNKALAQQLEALGTR